MIERVEVAGRMAMVSYLNDDFTPAHKTDATLIKVIFEDDGEVLFGVPASRKADAASAQQSQ